MGLSSSKQIDYPTRAVKISQDGTKEAIFTKYPHIIGRSLERTFSLVWENIGTSNGFCSITYYEGIHIKNHIYILGMGQSTAEVTVSGDSGCLLIKTPGRTYKLHHQDPAVISEWQYTLTLILNHRWNFVEKIDSDPSASAVYHLDSEEEE